MNVELRELLNQARKLLESGKKDEYLERLKSIYESHKDPVVVYLLFVQYISRYDYETVWKYLLLLKTTKAYMSDWYTYALLLSNFISIPDELRDELNNLEVKDFLISYKDMRFRDIKNHNLAREAIANVDYLKAIKCIGKIQLNNRLESQEYVIYRLLNDKVNRQSKRFVKAFKEERYDDILDALGRVAFLTAEDRMIRNLIYDLYDVKAGAIINRSAGKSNNIEEAIYNHDYKMALKYVDAVHNGVIPLLLQKIIDLTNENIIYQYSGDLGDLFYDYSQYIYAAIQEKDYMQIKNLIKEYFEILNRRVFNNFFVNLVDYFEAMGSGIENITSVMADVVYRKVLVDTEYLKKLFGDAIRKNNYKACESLIRAIDFLRDSDKKNIDIEFLRHVYNYQKYLHEGTKYKDMNQDIVFYDNIRSIHDKVMKYRLPEKAIAKNDYEERIIRNAINSYHDLGYVKIVNDDGTITFYIKKQNNIKNFDREGFLYHAKFFLHSNNFEGLKGLLLHGLTLVNRFDYTMFSLLAYAYEKLGEEDNLARIVEVLNKVWEISDYHEVIEDDELALVDVDSEYMYGIPNIELIINEVLNEGVSLNDAILKYKTDSEDIPYVTLIIARECYKEGNIELGDKYYALVEKEDITDQEFSHFLECVKANKSYYNSKYNVSFIDHVKKLINEPNKTND